MKIDEKLISYVEDLAYLSLRADERKKLTGDFAKILEAVSAIESVDTEDVIGLSHPYDFVGVLREDIEVPPMDRELVLSNAPKRSAEAIAVPRVIE